MTLLHITTHIQSYMYIHVYTYMYIHVYTYMYIHTCIYIHVHTCRHCTYHQHSGLLQEVLLAVGYFCVLHADNQVWW